jgi:hypothetical protein
MYRTENLKKFMKSSQLVQSPNRQLTDRVLPPDYNMVSQPSRPSILHKILLTFKKFSDIEQIILGCVVTQHLRIRHSSDLYRTLVIDHMS